MKSSRREFLQWGMGAGALVAALGPAGAAAQVQRQPLSGALRGYELLGVVPFYGDGDNFIGARVGEGLAARRALDLSTLTTKKLVTPTEEFFIRTGYPKSLEQRDGWTVTVNGRIEREKTFSLSELQALSEPLGVHLLECAGSTRNSSFGLMSAADWRGVPLSRLLDGLGPSADASQLLVSGIDPGLPGSPEQAARAEWIFSLDELVQSGAALALGMNGAPLPKDHGAPVRLVVPGWYGCCWIKWVDRISLLDSSARPTQQMMEYASRTHQAGTLELARDFRPASIEHCAMPVRVEQWSHDGEIFYRLVGVLWGGEGPIESLGILIDPGSGLESVQNYRHETNDTWTLWSHRWKPKSPGVYRVRLLVAGPSVRSWRMGAGYYDRAFRIGEV